MTWDVGRVAFHRGPLSDEQSTALNDGALETPYGNVSYKWRTVHAEPEKRIVGHVHDIRVERGSADEENGLEHVPVENELQRYEQRHVRNMIHGEMKDAMTGEAEDNNEADAWDAMPKQKQNEVLAQQKAIAEMAQQHKSNEIRETVDKHLSSGWKPVLKANSIGVSSKDMPDELKGFASPTSQIEMKKYLMSLGHKEQ